MRLLRTCGIALIAVLMTIAGLVAPAHADDPEPPAEATPVDTTEGAAAETPSKVIDEARPVEASSTEVQLVETAPEKAASETSGTESVTPQAEPTPTQQPTAEESETPTPTSATPTADDLDLPVATDGQEVHVASAPTEAEVSVAGVSWQESSADVQVFLRSINAQGDVSPWEKVETVADSPESTVEGTEPLVVTGNSTVQVAAVSSEPIVSTLSVVDPGTAPADTMATTSSTSTSAPVIYTRADWGADESMRGSDPQYAKVNGVVIHHTAGSNSYTEAQVPGIIRGIYSYHTQTLGWSDIGYNVLVDKFGRAWEGRFGGLTKAVQGAHAYGANHLTFGISMMGNYDTARPSAAAMDTVARVSGWKMGIHDVDTYATLRSSTGINFPAISGHRDTYSTACPGQYIYSQMSSLRSSIRSYQKEYASGVVAQSAGKKIVGETTYAWGTAYGSPNAEVWTEVLVGSSWSRSQTSQTNAAGSFTIPLTYGANSLGTQTWRVGVRSPRGVEYSNRFTMTRVEKPTVQGYSAGSKYAGQDTNAWGTSTGAANSEVWTEVIVNGKWSRSQISTTGDDGKFVIPLTYRSTTVGLQTWRVGVRTDVGVFYSERFTLNRTSPPVRVSAASAGTKPVGQETYAWGTASGAPNATVWSEVNVSGNWSRSQVRQTSATGWYTIPLTYGASQRGSYTWRVGVSTKWGTFYSDPFVLTRG